MLGGLEDFLVDQEEVGEREREDLVVWLHQVSNNLRQGTLVFILQCTQVCEEEVVKIEVLCLAVNCLDRSILSDFPSFFVFYPRNLRFLASAPIRLSQLQLLGSACLLVAWKVAVLKTHYNAVKARYHNIEKNPFYILVYPWLTFYSKVREDREIRLETILKYSNFSINADELLVSLLSMFEIDVYFIFGCETVRPKKSNCCPRRLSG